jgi:molybdate transport system substrate-binding protein
MNKSAIIALLGACLPALFLAAAETAAAQDTEIRVICSNGIRAAVEKLMPEYERSMGRSIKVQYGASAVLKRSIEGGAPFDLAILSAPVIADLIKEGKIGGGTGVDLASSGIGIAVRAGIAKPDVTTAGAIKQTLLRSKSIGYVKEGAGTPAIVNMLDRLGISADLQSKTVLQPGAEQSMASVASGQIEIAFALISEIVPAPGVQLAGPIPAEFQKLIIMTAGISSSTKNREAANQIIKSMTSVSASKTIKTAGLDPIAKQK